MTNFAFLNSFHFWHSWGFPHSDISNDILLNLTNCKDNLTQFQTFSGAATQYVYRQTVKMDLGESPRAPKKYGMNQMPSLNIKWLISSNISASIGTASIAHGANDIANEIECVILKNWRQCPMLFICIGVYQFEMAPFASVHLCTHLQQHQFQYFWNMKLITWGRFDYSINIWWIISQLILQIILRRRNDDAKHCLPFLFLLVWSYLDWSGENMTVRKLCWC